MKKKNIILIITVVTVFVCAIVCAFVFLDNSSGNSGDSVKENVGEDTVAEENIYPQETAQGGMGDVLTPSLDDVEKEKEQSSYEWNEDGNITTIQLNGDKVQIEGDGVTISDNDIIICQKGQYDISGTLNDGRIVVDAKGYDVVIRLNDAHINCSYSSPIYSYKSNNTVIILADGTGNSITDSDKYSYDDGYSVEAELEPNACLYSKTDLNICGTGSLTVNGNFEQGITGNDTLRIYDATLNVKSAGKGILGKDALTINEAEIAVNAADDGIHSNGNVVINGGCYTLSSGDDGIHGDLIVACYEGDININNSVEGVEGYYILAENSRINVIASDDGFNATDGSGSDMMGGMPPTEADNTVTIDSSKLPVGIEFVNSNIVVNAEGDGIDSNGGITFNGGTVLVYGPSNGGNAGLDYAGTCEFVAGTLIVLDVSGMCLVPNVCRVPGMDVTMNTYVSEGEVIKISSDREELYIKSVKQANHLTVITPNMSNGTDYTVTIGGTYIGGMNDYFSDTGEYSGGDAVVQITLEAGVTYYGSSGMGGFGGPGMGGPGGDGFGGPGMGGPDGGYGGPGMGGRR